MPNTSFSPRFHPKKTIHFFVPNLVFPFTLLKPRVFWCVFHLYLRSFNPHPQLGYTFVNERVIFRMVIN